MYISFSINIYFADGRELTVAEAEYIKEQHHKRVQKLVAWVAILLTVCAGVLVVLSLILGKKLDSISWFIFKMYILYRINE